MRFGYCLGSGNGTRSLVILSSLVLLAVTVDAQIALIEVYSNLFLFLFNFLNFFSSN